MVAVGGGGGGACVSSRGDRFRLFIGDDKWKVGLVYWRRWMLFDNTYLMAMVIDRL